MVPSRFSLLLVPLAALACGGHSMRAAGPDSGTPADGLALDQPDVAGRLDLVQGDGAAVELPPGCTNVAFTGTFAVGGQTLSFAEALALALQQKSLNHSLILGIEGATDTDGLRCFDGLLEALVLRQCHGPLRVSQLPSGMSELVVESSCTVSDLSGLVGFTGKVTIFDASSTTDFSPLASASYVFVYGDVALPRIAPHVQDASVLLLGVTATSLAPLNGAKAQFLWVDAKGLMSISDFAPSPSLTCFEIHLDPAASAEGRQALVDRLCSASRSAPECPGYGCCWDKYVKLTAPQCGLGS